MGNSIASKGSGWVKIMKVDGETIKLKSPVGVEQVVRDYPDHVVLHSDAVRYFGTKAKPLENSTQLKPKHLYFLISIPSIDDLSAPKRVRSDITMTAKSRLEAMMLAQRSISDIVLPSSAPECSSSSESGVAEGTKRVKVRMTKAQLTQLKAESNSSSETAEKILDIFLNDGKAQKIVTVTQNARENPTVGNIFDTCKKSPRNRVRFSPDVERVEAY